MESLSPLLRDLPSLIETERLVIRAPRPGDGPAHCEAVRASLEALRAFPASLSWAMDEPSVEASEMYCREGSAHHQLRTDMPMLLLLKATGACVGGTGLHDFQWAVPRCEIGFWLRTSHTGQGLAVEAVKAVTAFAVNILGMRRVEALPDDENLASCRVCEQAGYRLEGVLRNERVDPQGILRNTRLYAFTN